MLLANSGRERESASIGRGAAPIRTFEKLSHVDKRKLTPAVTASPRKKKKGGLGPLLLLQTTGEGTRLGHGGPRRCSR